MGNMNKVHKDEEPKRKSTLDLEILIKKEGFEARVKSFKGQQIPVLPEKQKDHC